MTKFIVQVQNKTSGEWIDAGERFESQSQAEQHIVDEIPEGYSARIVREK